MRSFRKGKLGKRVKHPLHAWRPGKVILLPIMFCNSYHTRENPITKRKNKLVIVEYKKKKPKFGGKPADALPEYKENLYK